MIGSREAKGALGRTVSPRAVSLLFHPSPERFWLQPGPSPKPSSHSERIIDAAKPVGLHVLHQSNTGDGRFIWRTVCWSQSAGGWAQDVYHLAGVFLPGSGSDHSTTGTVNYKHKLFCLFLHNSSSSVPQHHPVSPLSHHELASPLTQILLSLSSTGCGTSHHLLFALLILLAAPPLQADTLPELTSWLAASNKDLLQLNGT